MTTPPSPSMPSHASPNTSAAPTAPLSIRLFGPMRVLVKGEPLPPVRSRKTYWLLALLALRHGRPVEREWLAGVLWPDADRTQASANLRPALSQLRAVLGDAGERVQSPSRSLLRLDPAGADIDIVAFDSAIAGGHPQGLEQAVTLYQGPLLEGCAEEWVFQERDQRAQACLDALLRLAQNAAERGDHAAAAAFLRRAAALDPLSDSAHAALMQALARAGDRNAALEIYRAFSDRVRRELGGVPQETTTALYTRLRRAAREAARAPASQDAPAADAPAPAAGHLPHAVNDLVGREEEQTDIRACLRRSRLVTLAGPGGIGKTRLSVAVAGAMAGEYPDGAWFVALDSLPPGDDSGSLSLPVLQQIASVLRIKEAPGSALPATVTEYLRRKRLLLVLDNCEHVRLACSGAVAPILRECPGVRILATSREALRVTGETVWTVPALPVPDPDHLPGGTATLLRVLPAYEGIQLFLERARAVSRTFALSGENARDVALLCCRLGGVPLALELAAARTSVLSPARIRAQLDARPLDTLASRHSDVPSRHRTLRATLEWSYGLLPSAARTFLSDMGVFRGSWTLEAAQAVCPDTDAGELLTLLRDASLLDAVPGEDGEMRFRALETVREFAAEMLDKSGRGDDARRRHAAFFAAWAEKSTEDRQVQEGRAFVLVEKEYSNVRAALGYALTLGEDMLLVRLCHNVTYFWHNTGRNQEIRDWMARVAERLNPDSGQDADASGNDAQDSPRDSPRERFLRTQLWLCAVTGDFEGAAAASLSIFESYRRCGREIEGRTNLFNTASYLGTCDLNRTRDLLDQCLPLERATSADGRGNPVILSRLALVYRRTGQPEKAAVFLNESLFIANRDKETDQYGFAAAHFIAGLDALAHRDHHRAVPHLENCLMVFASQNSPFMNTNALIGLAAAARISGDREQSAAILARAVEAAGSEPSMKLMVALRREQGEHLLDAGDLAGAARLMRETLALLRGCARSLRAPFYELALLLAEAEFAPQAVPHNGRRTARLLGAAEGAAARLGLRAPGAEDLSRTARLTRSLLDLLGPDLLPRERAEGASLEDEAALAFALLPG